MNAAAVEAWLVARMGVEAGLPHGAIDPDTPVYRYGIDSRRLAFIIQDAEDSLSLVADLDRISPAETIAALALAFEPH